MSGELNISLSSEILDSGPEEERATFGLLSMTANDRLLTEGIDADSNEVRHGPHLSGYPLAEWLVWNWWRLRWEFSLPAHGSPASRWHFAHSLQTIGDGYVWPNITIFCDGLNASLISRPTSRSEAVLFRYIGAYRHEEVPDTVLEASLEEFVTGILATLEGNDLRTTNLHRLWNDLQTERQDPGLSRYRKLEAQLGFDPDDADEDAVWRRLHDASILGEEALGELASDATLETDPLNRMVSAEQISDIATRLGFDANLDDAVGLTETNSLPRLGEVAAWRFGKLLAHKIRNQENMDGRPIPNGRLAELAGTSTQLISNNHRCSPSMPFVLRRDDPAARFSLRSRWHTGRRFELARLLGDRLVNEQITQSFENLYPATRSPSYRQKMQRAFAAELLSPNAAVDDMLKGDYSEDNQNKVAKHFSVSPMTIQSQLVNHGRLYLEDAPDLFGRGGAFMTA